MDWLSFFRKPLPLGAWGEAYAAKLYQRRGFRILDRNYFNKKGKRLGEVDFVARQDRQLIFVEVKTRTSDTFGQPREAVGAGKQQRLLRAVKFFLLQHPEYAEHDCQIDVVEVVTDLDRKRTSATILENAVEDRQ